MVPSTAREWEESTPLNNIASRRVAGHKSTRGPFDILNVVISSLLSWDC